VPQHLPCPLRKARGVEEGDGAVEAEVFGERPWAGGLPPGRLYGATGASHADFTRPAEYTFAART